MRYTVINERTGNAISTFLLATDAMTFVKWLHEREGVHGPWYIIIDQETGREV